MVTRYRPWSGALTVMLITAALVVLDVSDASVHRYWSQHSFTSSVLSGVLVLLLTLLIVDRVTRARQLKDKSRAIAAQAAIVAAQASRTADLVSRPGLSQDDRDEATDELRTYTQMLLTSAPLLIDAKVSRTFLEAAQRLAAQLFRVLHADGEKVEPSKAQLDQALAQLRSAAGPLLQALSSEQRAAIPADDA